MRWKFVDSLRVVNMYAGVAGECAKLQCLSQRCGPLAGHAHRALDDCVSLKHVCTYLADSGGMSVGNLLCPFVVELDFEQSLANFALTT